MYCRPCHMHGEREGPGCGTERCCGSRAEANRISTVSTRPTTSTVASRISQPDGGVDAVAEHLGVGADRRQHRDGEHRDARDDTSSTQALAAAAAPGSAGCCAGPPTRWPSGSGSPARARGRRRARPAIRRSPRRSSPAAPRAGRAASPMIGNCAQRRVEHLVLEVGVALEEEAEDRRGEQQQREDRDEGVVGERPPPGSCPGRRRTCRRPRAGSRGRRAGAGCGRRWPPHSRLNAT